MTKKGFAPATRLLTMMSTIMTMSTITLLIVFVTTMLVLSATTKS